MKKQEREGVPTYNRQQWRARERTVWKREQERAVERDAEVERERVRLLK